MEKKKQKTKASVLITSFFKNPMGLIGTVLVLFFLMSALFAPVITAYPPNEFVGDSLAPPSWSHLIGTDELGRDTFTRLVYGGRIELILAIITVSISLGLGMMLGIIAGYGPVWLDNLIILAFDTIRSFPSIVLTLAILALSEPSVVMVGIVFIIGSVPDFGRIVRSQTLSIKNTEFILAERSLGAGFFFIARRHILPNILGPLLILAAMEIPVIVSVEAGLSFLGLGVLPPTPTWGTIMNEGFSVIRFSPWPLIAGGAPLVLTTLGFTFFSEALRDVLDPKTGADT